MNVGQPSYAWYFDPRPVLDVEWCHRGSVSQSQDGSLLQMAIEEKSDENAAALQEALEADLERVHVVSCSWEGKTAEELFEEAFPGTGSLGPLNS